MLTAALRDAVFALARSCVRRAGLVAAGALLIVALAGIYLVQNLDVDTNLDELIDPDAPFRERQAALFEAFPHQDDRVVLVVEGGTLDARLAATEALAARLTAREDEIERVFAPALLPFFVENALLFEDIDDVEQRLDRLAEAQPLLAALGREPTPDRLVALLADGLAEEEPPVAFLDAVDRLAPVLEAAANGRLEPIAWLELTDGEGAEDAPFIVEVTPALDFDRLQPGKAALEAVRAISADVADAHLGVRIDVTGEVALEAEELAAAATGATGAGLASLVLVALVLAWTFRSPGAIAAVLTTLVSGLVLTGAFAMAAVGAFTMISIAFAVLFIGLGVDFAIHVVLRAQEETADGARWRDSVAAGTGATAPALLLCAPTTAVAFLAFTPTGYVGLAELGLIAAAGMLIALALSLTLLPALLAILAGPRPLPPVPWTTARPRVAQWSARLLLGLGVVSLAGLGSLRFAGDPLVLKDPDAPSVAAFEQLLEVPTRSPYRAELLVADAEAAARRAQRLAELDEVARVVWVESFVPAQQERKLALIDDAALFFELPTPEGELAADAQALRRELARLGAAAPPGPLRDAPKALAARLDRQPELARDIREAWFRYWPQAAARTRALFEAAPVTRDELPDALRERYVAPDGRLRLEILPATSLRATDARERFVEAVLQAAPDAAGNVVQMTLSAELVARAMLEATAYALLAVTVLVGIVLRRPFEIAAVIGAVLLAAALTAGAMALLGLSFNFANVIVLPLLLGFGVDAAIHVVMRARERASARIGATSTPRAVLASALTTLASFGALAFSPHQGTASMGLLLTIAVLASLATALVALPAWLERRTPL